MYIEIKIVLSLNMYAMHFTYTALFCILESIKRTRFIQMNISQDSNGLNFLWLTYVHLWQVSVEVL